MGIVKISDELHDAAKQMAKSMNRSINAQSEYWMRVGKLLEANPTLTYAAVFNTIINSAILEAGSRFDKNL